MAVAYSQNGVIVKQTDTDWFSGSPNFSMYELNQPIIEGTITNQYTNYGIFKTPSFNFSQFNLIEQNVKYQILGWNADNLVFAGQFKTSTSSKNYGLTLYIAADKFILDYYLNGDQSGIIHLEEISHSFSIGDIIENKLIIDKQNSTIYAKIKQNGNIIFDKTYTNINITYIDTQFYFFGIRFSDVANYASPAKLFLDSTNFKNENGIIWGSTKV